MNPEVKEKWVQALRSGEYKQGKGVLRIGDSYCCLGVLCDVAVKNKYTDLEWELSDPIEETDKTYRIGGEYAVLPAELLDEFFDHGTDSCVEIIDMTKENVTDLKIYKELESVGDQYYSLADLNDDFALSFKEIADIIERNL